MPPKTLFSVHVGIAEGGIPLYAWDPRGQVLASVSRHHNRLNLFDRRGTLLDQVQFSGKSRVRMMDWDQDGEVLAILQQEASTLLLYHQNARRVEEFDPKQKDISFIRWSRSGPSLAIGTAKGNLVVFNRKTLKRYPVIGKHTKRITMGDWGNRNELALGGEDKMVRVLPVELHFVRKLFLFFFVGCWGNWTEFIVFFPHGFIRWNAYRSQ
jgi:WD repeat-containing protein 19